MRVHGADERCVGTVKRWMEEKGYGWIRPTDGSECVFCHRDRIVDGSWLKEGQMVMYRPEANLNHPEKVLAMDVRRVEPQSSVSPPPASAGPCPICDQRGHAAAVCPHRETARAAVRAELATGGPPGTPPRRSPHRSAHPSAYTSPEGTPGPTWSPPSDDSPSRTCPAPETAAPRDDGRPAGAPRPTRRGPGKNFKNVKDADKRGARRVAAAWEVAQAEACEQMLAQKQAQEAAQYAQQQAGLASVEQFDPAFRFPHTHAGTAPHAARGLDLPRTGGSRWHAGSGTGCGEPGAPPAPAARDPPRGVQPAAAAPNNGTLRHPYAAAGAQQPGAGGAAPQHAAELPCVGASAPRWPGAPPLPRPGAPPRPPGALPRPPTTVRPPSTQPPPPHPQPQPRAAAEAQAPWSAGDQGLTAADEVRMSCHAPGMSAKEARVLLARDIGRWARSFWPGADVATSDSFAAFGTAHADWAADIAVDNCSELKGNMQAWVRSLEKGYECAVRRVTPKEGSASRVWELTVCRGQAQAAVSLTTVDSVAAPQPQQQSDGTDTGGGWAAQLGGSIIDVPAGGGWAAQLGGSLIDVPREPPAAASAAARPRQQPGLCTNAAEWHPGRQPPPQAPQHGLRTDAVEWRPARDGLRPGAAAWSPPAGDGQRAQAAATAARDADAGDVEPPPLADA